MGGGGGGWPVIIGFENTEAVENSGTRGQRVNPGKSGVKQLGGGLAYELNRVKSRGGDLTRS